METSMLKLEGVKVGLQVTGIVPGHVARIVSVEPAGSDAITVIVKSELGVAEQQLYRSDEVHLAIAEKNLPWSFEAPADDFKLALEAFRIELGSAFDPMMAIHSSNVIPLPHQISAVYEKMLPQEPLRYVLADDPGVRAELFVRGTHSERLGEGGRVLLGPRLDLELGVAAEAFEAAGAEHHVAG